MLSDSDESYTSSSHSEPIVQDRVQKLFDRLKEKKALDEKRRDSILNTKKEIEAKVDQNKKSLTGASRGLVDLGTVKKQQVSKDHGDSKKKNYLNDPSIHPISVTNKNNMNYLNRNNEKNLMLQQDGSKAKKSMEELWKEKMCSLGTDDSTATSEDSEEELLHRSFATKVAERTEAKDSNRLKHPEEQNEDFDFARKKTEEWLRTSLTVKDGQNERFEIGDSSSGGQSDVELTATLLQKKRADPMKILKEKFTKAVTRNTSPTKTTGLKKTLPRLTDSKKGSLTKKILPTKEAAQKISDSTKHVDSDKKQTVLSKSELTKKLGSLKKEDTIRKTDTARKPDIMKKPAPTPKVDQGKKQEVTKKPVSKTVVSGQTSKLCAKECKSEIKANPLAPGRTQLNSVSRPIASKATAQANLNSFKNIVQRASLAATNGPYISTTTNNKLASKVAPVNGVKKATLKKS